MSMKYGFDQSPTETIKLPPVRTKPAEPAADMSRVLQAGQELGFVSREGLGADARRKPGPKRKEAQDKIGIAGPKRIIDRLKAYCDRTGLTYCDAIDTLLDGAEK